MVVNSKVLAAQTNTLTSLAILKVDIDEGARDYIDYLVAFAVEALAIHRPEIVSDTLVVELLDREFGLRIPLKAVQHVLRKLVKKFNFLEHRDGAYFLSQSLPNPSMSVRRQAAEENINSVIQRLCVFSQEIGQSPPWTPDVASAAIMSFLGRFAIDCLKTHIFNTVLPSVPESGVREHYIVGRFVSESYANDRELFESFIVLVKGQMYANALTCPDLQSLQQHFNKLTCYLDTPVVLNLLGLHGKANETAAVELVDLTKALGGSVAIFHHTLEETLGVIRFAISHFQDLRVSNRVLRELRAANKSKSDLVLMEGGLEDILKSRGVRVFDTPPYTNALQIDERAFRDALADEIDHLGAQALNFDVNSVRSVYVKRNGVSPSRLEDAVAVLVTSNSTFSRVAFEEGKKHNSAREVSPVITDYSLANIAWLKAPLKNPTLPERETLALCYAALEPSRALVEKYVKTMDELRSSGKISENDHAILRASSIAEAQMMDMTLGDDKALTQQRVVEILARAKATLLTEVTNQHRDVLGEKEADLAAMKEHLAQVASEKENARRDAEAVRAAVEMRSKKLAKIVFSVVFGFLSFGLLFGAFIAGGVVSTEAEGRTDFVKWLMVGVAVLTILWGWWNWHTGQSLRSLLKGPESRLSKFIATFLLGGS